MRILVVDDDERLADLIRRSLEAESFTVRLAHDGATALELAARHEYDAMVLDLMLPRVNGYQVCRTLRAAENWVPILMLTAKDGEYDEADGLDVGADDYLTKPFSYLVLSARLRALVRRRGVGRPAVIRVRDLTVDPATMSCTVGETEIRLTTKEFAVLAFLARRVGQVVSKTELIEGVWDVAYDGGFNLVEVYVSALRRKIDQPFGRSSIHTVRGSGYRLV